MMFMAHPNTLSGDDLDGAARELFAREARAAERLSADRIAFLVRNYRHNFCEGSCDALRSQLEDDSLTGVARRLEDRLNLLRCAL